MESQEEISLAEETACILQNNGHLSVCEEEKTSVTDSNSSVESPLSGCKNDILHFSSEKEMCGDAQVVSGEGIEAVDIVTINNDVGMQIFSTSTAIYDIEKPAVMVQSLPCDIQPEEEMEVVEQLGGLHFKNHTVDDHNGSVGETVCPQTMDDHNGSVGDNVCPQTMDDHNSSVGDNVCPQIMDDDNGSVGETVCPQTMDDHNGSIGETVCPQTMDDDNGSVGDTVCPQTMDDHNGSIGETVCPQTMDDHNGSVGDIVCPQTMDDRNGSVGETVCSQTMDDHNGSVGDNVCPQTMGDHNGSVGETVCPQTMGDHDGSVGDNVCPQTMGDHNGSIGETVCPLTMGDHDGSVGETVCPQTMDDHNGSVGETVCPQTMDDHNGSDGDIVCPQTMDDHNGSIGDIVCPLTMGDHDGSVGETVCPQTMDDHNGSDGDIVCPQTMDDHNGRVGETVCPQTMGDHNGSIGQTMYPQTCVETDCTYEIEDSSSEDSSSDSETDSDSSSSSSSSSLSLISVLQADEELLESNDVPIKTKGELLVNVLPAVQELSISLPDDVELKPFGTISSIIEQLVIVESSRDIPPLNEGSVVFKEDRHAVGKIFEVFGPVPHPFYVIRFHSEEHIQSSGIKIKDTLFFAPSVEDFTQYIMPDALKRDKGSDASWTNDQEPPTEVLDYSDDEKEREAKQKKKTQRKQQFETDNSSTSFQESSQAYRGQKFSRPYQRNGPAPRFSHGWGPQQQGNAYGQHQRPRFSPNFARQHVQQPYRYQNFQEYPMPLTNNGYHPPMHNFYGQFGNMQAFSLPPPPLPPPPDMGWSEQNLHFSYMQNPHYFSLPPPPPPPPPPSSPNSGHPRHFFGNYK